MSMFSDNLRIARLKIKMNQAELAIRLNVTQATISQYEKGDRIPDKIKLHKIADILGLTIEKLIGNEEGSIGQAFLLKKIKGLSPNSIEKICDYVDYLKFKQK